MSQKLITILLCLATIILIGAVGVLYFLSDRQGPEIRINEDITSYREGDNTAVLLEGVTAYDKADGDVTETLIVNDIIPLPNGRNVKIIYVAKDKSNNITKTEIVIEYITKETEGVEASNSEGVQEETNEEQGTDETGDGQPEEGTEGEAANEDETPLESTGAPVIRLTTTQVTVTAGSFFDAVDYVDEIVDDVDDRSTLFRRIQLGGDYYQGFTSVAGTYEIWYYVTDTDGNQSNVEKLTVVVQ